MDMCNYCATLGKVVKLYRYDTTCITACIHDSQIIPTDKHVVLQMSNLIYTNHVARKRK